jgi:glycosyltransferase involved in cell wall biosynthesis
VRIAFVAHGYPERETGGVELVAREQAEALAARGHAVAVFARTREPNRAEASTWDETVRGVPVRRVVYNEPYSGSFTESYDHHRLDAPFADFLAAMRPDVVHVQHLVLMSPNLLAVARASGIPCVVSLHDFYFLCHRLFLLDRDGRRCAGPEGGARCVDCLAGWAVGDEARRRFQFMAEALGGADRIVAPSPSLARRFVAEWSFLDGRIRVVEPGLGHVPHRDPMRRFGRGRPGDPLRLLFIGTWLPHKGLDLLVDAVLGIAPGRVELGIHGAGVAGQEGWVGALRERSRGRGVEWHGPFEADALERILAGSDVLVLPSRCDESYSRVVREARAAGLAVIAPTTGGPGDLLRHETDALLVAPDDAAALAGAVARLLDDPALVRRLARAPVATPTVEAAAGQLESLYEELRSLHGEPR